MKLGVFDPFNASRADFRGIADGQNLFVSDAVHKAFVAIDEKGTEAAAATGISLSPSTTALHLQPLVFTADHPFIVIIRDVKQNRVLFTGRVTNPKT